MKTIKNFEGFKKSLLVATNGTMEETFDSSVLFSGGEYHSYRVYVDAIHYYNMFVIHNIATNTYDVSLETSCCGASTMSRTIKTQKALIKSVVAWIDNNYLDVKTISEDSENYTDRCEPEEPEEPEETVKDIMEVKQALNSRFGKEQCFDTDSVQPNKTIIAKIEDINYCPNQNTCCIVSPYVHCDYNYKSEACVKAHKNFIHDCELLHKQIKAISNPEWHNVSLATLANIDFDMLDEKRQLYLSLYREIKELLKDLHNCKSGRSYEKRLAKMHSRCADLVYENKVTSDYIRYVTRKVSMCNVECGLWTSATEESTGYHKSRRYNHLTIRY